MQNVIDGGVYVLVNSRAFEYDFRMKIIIFITDVTQSVYV